MRVIRQILLALVVASPLAAQGLIEPVERWTGNGGVERVRSAVQVDVSGRVARVTVEEWFRNNGGWLGEGTYVYPLPGEAVFSNLSLWSGDAELKGEVMDASQARGIYEEIVRRRRDPGLVELAGYGMIRARVFPINPGETRKITLRYTQVLDKVGDAWRFRYAGSGGAPRSIRLNADSADRFGTPYSPTHVVTTTRAGGRLTVALADSTAGGDVELFLPLTHGLVGASLVTYKPAGEDGYFLLLLAPSQATPAAALPRDLVAVLDVSGSMGGDKIAQAKAALTQLLGTLREGDRFRMIAFSSDVRPMASGWIAWSPAARQSALDWINSLVADGGTNIAGALHEAFTAAPADGHLGVVVFLTDGLPTVGESDPERLAGEAEHERGNFRVFSFGIGYDVNTYLLDRIAVQARGASAYVAPGGDIEQAVSGLAHKIASPVVTDLSISGDGAEVYDVQPGQLPDLFAGDESIVLGRYRGVGSGEWDVTVRGQRNGSVERFTAHADTATTTAAGYVAQLWAARKAGAVERLIRLQGATPELMNELKQLALRYGILTEYTSYLVQEPTPVAWHAAEDRMLMRAQQAVPAAMAGAGAVAQSTQDAAMAKASVLADSTFREAARVRSGIAPTERAGGRLFMLRDSVWTDLLHGDSLAVTAVAPFSNAYFALLQALPELVEPARLAPAVLVAGAHRSVKIQAGGITAWRPGELDKLVKEFRG